MCDPRLAEIDFGELDGLTYDEAARRFPAVYGRWMAAPTAVQFPGGESFADVRARVAGVLAEVATAASAGPRSVVVVTHGGPIRAALVRRWAWTPPMRFVSPTIAQR